MFFNDVKIFVHHTKTNEHCAELFELLKEKFDRVYLIVLNSSKQRLFDDIKKPNYEFHNICCDDDWHSSYKTKETIKLQVYSIITNLVKQIERNQ